MLFVEIPFYSKESLSTRKLTLIVMHLDYELSPMVAQRFSAAHRALMPIPERLDHRRQEAEQYIKKWTD